jgi:D-inositol-3-phosphate glycosyltransferase
VAYRADALVVSTQQEKDDLVRLYRTPPHKIGVIPAGVDPELFRPGDQIRARSVLGLGEKRVILYVGRVEPLKGLDILINAFALLEDTNDTRLLVVGGRLGQESELDRLRSVAVQLGIGDRVTFAGAVKHAELPDYYNAADIFVLPSYYESFGLVALEAMACGTPVVVSRVGGLKTFIKDGEHGYLIPWQCPEPFAQRMDVLLSNPGLRESMGRAARGAAQKMSWSGVADRMLDFYAGLLGESLESLVGA